MNRLSPKIVRRAPSAFQAAGSPSFRQLQATEAPSATSGDLRLFAMSFIGGLAFFGTYIA